MAYQAGVEHRLYAGECSQKLLLLGGSMQGGLTGVCMIVGASEAEQALRVPLLFESYSLEAAQQADIQELPDQLAEFQLLPNPPF